MVEPSAVESYIAAIHEKTSDILKGKNSIDEALTFAMKMEESILEGRFYETVKSNGESFNRLVEVLTNDLARHRQQIIDEMERIEEV
jgi:hypothetical protein